MARMVIEFIENATNRTSSALQKVLKVESYERWHDDQVVGAIATIPL
jgi:hypothetical protein